jgi:protein-tyrosine phosphatase
LYLGGYTSALNLSWLETTGITHNINLSNLVCDNPLDKLIIDIDDRHSSNIASHFETCNLYIDKALSNGGKVLVNCYAGISRSTTIVTAYLIWKKYHLDSNKGHNDLEKILRFIQSKRLCILPNVGFLDQLYEYYEKINNIVKILLNIFYI